VRISTRLSWLVVLCLGCLVLPGCGGGLSKASFDKITTGQSLTDVEGLLGGKGTEMTGDAANTLMKGMGDFAGKAGGKEAGDAMGALGGMVNLLMPKVYRWGDDNKYIIVAVMGGKVVGKDQKGL
jgi:hypothetical protein